MTSDLQKGTGNILSLFHACLLLVYLSKQMYYRFSIDVGRAVTASLLHYLSCGSISTHTTTHSAQHSLRVWNAGIHHFMAYNTLTHRPLFPGFFIGGIECSTHRRRDGKRLDIIAQSRHDDFVYQDYQRLQAQGIYTIRSAVRWHLVEPQPHQYDFSSLVPHIRAAEQTGMTVIWDLCHYGVPDDLDIFGATFVERFTQYVRAVTRFFREETEMALFFAPINEISFFAWAGGEVGFIYPFAQNRGMEVKIQLVRATVSAIDAVWEVAPDARIVHVDPLINAVCDPARPQDAEAVEAARLIQYQGWDMVAGKIYPDLGGNLRYLDIIGVNYYPYNQWLYQGSPYEGKTLDRFHPLYRPFHQMLLETYERYQRPLFVAETGTEGEVRPAWFAYIADEVQRAIDCQVPVEGICLYPIFNHPGWDDERHCHNGLWDYADDSGHRPLYAPLAAELQRWQQRLEGLTRAGHCPP